MTTPTYYSTKYTPLVYPQMQGFFTLAPQNPTPTLLTTPLHTLNYQMPYHYLIAQTAPPYPYQNYTPNVTISPGMTQQPQMSQVVASEVPPRPT